MTAERSFLRRLGGSCATPLAAHARDVADDALLELHGLCGLPDGTKILQATQRGPRADAERLGIAVAEALCAGRGRDHRCHTGVGVRRSLREGCPMSAFVDAQQRIKAKTTLSNDALLALYALYKQATAGDAAGVVPACSMSRAAPSTMPGHKNVE